MYWVSFWKVLTDYFGLRNGLHNNISIFSNRFVNGQNWIVVRNCGSRHESDILIVLWLCLGLFIDLIVFILILFRWKVEAEMYLLIQRI